MSRLLGQVRRRFSRRTGVRRRGLWRPSPRIRIEFGHGVQIGAAAVFAGPRAGL